jgi:hypothetical protein
MTHRTAASMTLAVSAAAGLMTKAADRPADGLPAATLGGMAPDRGA